MTTFPAIHMPGFYTGRHGPSMKIEQGNGCKSIDQVPCINCTFWPTQAQEWLERKRLSNWPSPEQIHKAGKEGCKLVAIGSCPGSTWAYEWRISFSLLERELIRSWNNTQVKCFAFLKSKIMCASQRNLPHLLKSYHLKTVMFWYIEETHQDDWVPELLLLHIYLLLKKLRQCVESENCPHYFIRQNNLFESKFIDEEKKTILQEMADIGIEMEVKYLCISKRDLSIESDVPNLGDLMQSIDATPPIYLFICPARSQLYLNFLADNLALTTIQKHKQLELHHTQMFRFYQVGMRRVMKVMLRPLYTSLGSHILAQAMETQNQDTKDTLLAQALYYLEQGMTFDAMSGKIKLAVFHYMIGNYSGLQNY